MCGLCLPRCPTYQQTLSEAESPRGRISLMRALHLEELPLDNTLEKHLNNCLTCRACEAACPSGVKYGYLIDQTRQQIYKNTEKNNSIEHFVLFQVLTHRAYLKLLNITIWLYQVTGLRKLAQILRIFNLSKKATRLDQLLPQAHRPSIFKAYYAPKNTHKKDITLFLGCASESFEPNTLRATIKLLTQLGYGVHIPKKQSCCGALHQHQGDHETAQHFIKNNTEAFNTQPNPDVISVATGCTSMLSEYNEHLAQETNWHALDIMDFLAKENVLSTAQFKPLKQVIAIHTPCSMNNVLKIKQLTYQLLSYIPKIQLATLSSNHTCCGAAGSYMLTQPDMADKLRESKLSDIQEIAPDIVVSTNIGCAIHIAAGLKKQSKPTPVTHPIELLAQQLIST